MPIRFAHMSDVHLGAFREKELRELNIRAFENAVDACVERGASFVIIAGDFFDIALPEMGVVDRAVRKMRQAQGKGLNFYLVYGSHDYSPTETSIIDVLCSAGVLVKVAVAEESTDETPRVSLKVFRDEKTGVSFAGVSARARGLEEADFEKINFSPLEKIPNPKIFIFHSAIKEYTPEELRGFGGGVPIRSLPKGFDYYASGHVHLQQVIRDNALGGKPLVYPGPLFASDYRDLESLSKEKHGFWFCELGENGECKVERVELDVCGVEYLQYDASSKSPAVVQQDLLGLLNSRDLDGKIVLLKVSGVLESGSPREVDFTLLREKAGERKALVFYVNRNALEEKEKEIPVSSQSDSGKIEDDLFHRSLESLAGVSPGLKGSAGLAISTRMLGVLKSEQLPGEAKGDFEKKIGEGAKVVFEGE
ncbi:MAG: DNA repair exonuclease [Candidatus Micrarchaeota archaeon]